MSRTPGLAPTGLPLQEVFSSGTLVAANANVVSAWVDVRTLARLLVSRAATAGAYVLEIEWSRDGIAVDIIQTLAVGNNSAVEVLVAAPFVRFRVRNTDALVAFTAHRTNAFGR